MLLGHSLITLFRKSAKCKKKTVTKRAPTATITKAPDTENVESSDEDTIPPTQIVPVIAANTIENANVDDEDDTPTFSLSLAEYVQPLPQIKN